MQVYSMILHESRGTFIWTHYILCKHPIHRGGAMRLCPTLLALDMQDCGHGLRGTAYLRSRRIVRGELKACPVALFGQQGTDAEPERLNVLRLTYRVGSAPGKEGVFTRPRGRG